MIRRPFWAPEHFICLHYVEAGGTRRIAHCVSPISSSHKLIRERNQTHPQPTIAPFEELRDPHLFFPPAASLDGRYTSVFSSAGLSSHFALSLIGFPAKAALCSAARGRVFFCPPINGLNAWYGLADTGFVSLFLVALFPALS